MIKQMMLNTLRPWSQETTTHIETTATPCRQYVRKKSKFHILRRTSHSSTRKGPKKTTKKSHKSETIILSTATEVACSVCTSLFRKYFDIVKIEGNKKNLKKIGPLSSCYKIYKFKKFIRHLKFQNLFLNSDHGPKI